MHARWLVVLGSAALMALGQGCKQNTEANAPATNTVGVNGSLGASLGSHGGAMASAGGLTTEVVVGAQGLVTAYVQNAQQQPVAGATVKVNVQKSDGTAKPVAMAWDAATQAYVGRVSGVEPGAHQVTVSVDMNAQASAQGSAQGTAPAVPTAQGSGSGAIEVVVPAVNVSSVATAPAPKHGGRVEIVGDYSVEVVGTHEGQVNLWVSDLQGNAVPPETVQIPTFQVKLTGGDQYQTVQPQKVGDHFVAQVNGQWETTATIETNLNLAVNGRVWVGGSAPQAPVVVAVQDSVPSAETVVVTGGATGTVQVTAPPPPSVGTSVHVQVTAPPPPSTVTAGVNVQVTAPPPPSVNVQAQAHGGVIVPPPPPTITMAPQGSGGVIIAPPPPVVMINAPPPVVVAPGPPVVVVPPPPSGGVHVTVQGSVQGGIPMPPPPPTVGGSVSVHGAVHFP